MQQEINQVLIDELTAGLGVEAAPIIDQLRSIVSKIQLEINNIDLNEFIFLEQKKQKERSQRLLKKLDEKYITNYSKDLIQNTELVNKITNSVVQLYFLTEEFFAVAGVIQKPRFLMTYVRDGKYIRHDFEKDLKDNASKFLNIEREGHSKDGVAGFGLRFKTSSVMEQMKKVVQDNEKEEAIAKGLYSHYVKFIEPYQTYSNQRNWKLNEGVAREAFESHLEKLHSELPEEFKDCQTGMESVGRRWVMYRYASGSDPYFTGPDTLLSQVKSENASLVSNINTVLNTALFIVKYGLNTSIQELKDLLKTKGQGEINTFSKQIWQDVSENVRNEIVEEMVSDLNYNNYHVSTRGKVSVSIRAKKI